MGEARGVDSPVVNGQGKEPQERSLSAGEFSWPFWPAVPLYPYGRRQTLRREVVKDTIWTFDQIQGIFYVTVPIRMTVVRLEAGGLFVYAPVAPTPECIRMVKELVAAHGDVKYILLPTVSAVEHKVFVGPFARCFPTAQVFIAPDQWSFPLNLPLSWLGFPSGRTHLLGRDSSTAPFANELDYAVLGPIGLGLGLFEEVAVFHRRSRTLLLTDSIMSVPEEPPEIVQLDPYPLLFHARDDASEAIVDSPENRRKGWQRISLFSFYFQPKSLETMGLAESLQTAAKAPNRSRKAYFGLYPFRWKSSWQQSFAALRGNGRLFVAPILQTLILNRAPQETLAWAERVASWNFERIIPCHLDAPLSAQPEQFRQAFTFLKQNAATGTDSIESESYPLPSEDFELLKTLNKILYTRRIVPPPQERL